MIHALLVADLNGDQISDLVVTGWSNSSTKHLYLVVILGWTKGWDTNVDDGERTSLWYRTGTVTAKDRTKETGIFLNPVAADTNGDGFQDIVIPKVKRRDGSGASETKILFGALEPLKDGRARASALKVSRRPIG